MWPAAEAIVRAACAGGEGRGAGQGAAALEPGEPIAALLAQQQGGPSGQQRDHQDARSRGAAREGEDARIIHLAALVPVAQVSRRGAGEGEGRGTDDAQRGDAGRLH
jgi:hypothetical protein